MNPIAVPVRPDFLRTAATIASAAGQAGVAGLRLSIDVTRAADFAKIVDPSAKFTMLGKLGMANSPFSLFTGAINSVHQAAAATVAVTTYLRTRTDEDRDAAIGTVAKLSTTAVGISANAAETFVVTNKVLGGYRAAKLAFETAAPMADPRVAKAAAWAATKHLLEHGGAFTRATNHVLRARAAALDLNRLVASETTRAATTASMAAAVRRAVIGKSKALNVSTTMALGTANHEATRQILTGAANAASEAALEAGARAAQTRAAFTFARLVPGINIALAALDTAQAYATFRDKKASKAKKAAHFVMMLGAWATATNIPGYSQIGALVSMAAAFTGSFL